MSGSTSQLISVQDLRSRLEEPGLVIVDTRFDLTDPAAGRRAYERAHLPGAVYFDLDRDLSSPVREHGGRHPLPDLETFRKKLESAGIGNHSQVVVYDADSGMFAARLWWLLRYMGHDAVKLLDGGFAAWQQAGYDTSAEPVHRQAAEFELRLRPGLALDMQQVKAKLEQGEALLIDARAAPRYRGEIEPLDPRAGHIPGAVNYPFADNLEGGKFKDRAALKERFAAAEAADEVIVYCGSGVSAAHDILALAEAGIADAKLYVGSWSDWSSYPENLVETGG